MSIRYLLFHFMHGVNGYDHSIIPFLESNTWYCFLLSKCFSKKEKKREYDFSRLVTRRPDHKSALSIYHVLAISEYL